MIHHSAVLLLLLQQLLLLLVPGLADRPHIYRIQGEKQHLRHSQVKQVTIAAVNTTRQPPTIRSNVPMLPDDVTALARYAQVTCASMLQKTTTSRDIQRCRASRDDVVSTVAFDLVTGLPLIVVCC
jgi:hypothetical protein